MGQVGDTYYSLMDMAFSTKAVFTHGLDSFIEAMANNRAGKVLYSLMKLN